MNDRHAVKGDVTLHVRECPACGKDHGLMRFNAVQTVEGKHAGRCLTDGRMLILQLSLSVGTAPRPTPPQAAEEVLGSGRLTPAPDPFLDQERWRRNDDD